MKLNRDLYNESVLHLIVVYANIVVAVYLLLTWRSSSPVRDRIRIVFVFFNLWMQFMWVCNGNECFLIVWEKQHIMPEYTKGQCPGIWPMSPVAQGNTSVVNMVFEAVFLAILLFDFDEAPTRLRVLLAVVSVIIYLRRSRIEKEQRWMNDPVCQQLMAKMDELWGTE